MKSDSQTSNSPGGDRREGFESILIDLGNFSINLIENIIIAYGNRAGLMADGARMFRMYTDAYIRLYDIESI